MNNDQRQHLITLQLQLQEIADRLTAIKPTIDINSVEYLDNTVIWLNNAVDEIRKAHSLK